MVVDRVLDLERSESGKIGSACVPTRAHATRGTERFLMRKRSEQNVIPADGDDTVSGQPWAFYTLGSDEHAPL